MENIFEKGMVTYPDKMKYETLENKKAGYAEIVGQLEELTDRMTRDYNLHDAVCVAKTLMDTLTVMSPEIYEHYRKVQDMLKTVVRVILKKEELTISQFGSKSGNKNKSNEDLSLLAQILLLSSQKDYLLAEKYEALGRALEMRSL